MEDILTAQTGLNEGATKYLIYKPDDATMHSGGIQRILEEVASDQKTKAIEYLELL